MIIRTLNSMLAVILLFAITSPDNCVAQPPPDAQTMLVGDQSVWLRQVTQLSSKPDPQSQLTVAVNGTVSVYLNGQRLVRDVNLSGIKATWHIGKLLRLGRNCVAISADYDQRTAATVWFSGNTVPQLPVKNWKSISSAPPVGWQQTDFNDRDWKQAAVGSSLTKNDLEDLKSKPMQWVRQNGDRRVREGFLSLQDGDHVLMLGGTFIERAQSFGYLESAISCSANGNVTFRNLGWSADTVFAESRGMFDSPAKGYERMIEHIRAEEPNMVLICYGQNEAMSFAQDAAGVQRYKDQLVQLCKDVGSTGAEVILLSPHPFLDLQKPFPSPSRWNSSLAEISTATRSVADSLQIHFVNLFDSFIDQLTATRPAEVTMAMIGKLPDHPSLAAFEQSTWSDNGMHWNSRGYSKVAHVVQARLTGPAPASATIQVDLDSFTVNVSNGSVRNVKSAESGKGIEFELKADIVAASPMQLQVQSQRQDLQLTAAVQKVNQAAELLELIVAEEESSTLLTGFLNPEFEAVRQLTIRKNELYFYRWRPQNITYLFGFRKHEQGNNASEIAQFDPLIAQLEEQIAKARQPQWHKIIIREVEGNPSCEH